MVDTNFPITVCVYTDDVLHTGKINGRFVYGALMVEAVPCNDNYVV